MINDFCTIYFINFIAEVKVSTPFPLVGPDSKASAKHILHRPYNTTFSHCFSVNSQNVSHLLSSYFLFSLYVESRDTFYCQSFVWAVSLDGHQPVEENNFSIAGRTQTW